MQYSPKRITFGSIDTLVQDSEHTTRPIGETTFYETLFLLRIKAALPRNTICIPTQNDDNPAPDNFLELVDQYLTSEKMYLASITSYGKRLGGFTDAKHITGVLHKQTTDTHTK